MILDVWTPLPSSVLAFVTTVHAALLVLRKHRSGRSVSSYLLLGAPAAFACSPWIFPSLAAIAAGAGAHVLWFVVAERINPAAPPPPAARPAAPAAAAATTPRAAPLRVPPAAFTPAAILAVVEESPDVRTFRIARPPDLTLRAGQFLTVRVQIDGAPHTRCYSISSAPATPGFLEITVKRQGLVSNTLHATLRPGSTLLVGRPSGRFVYPEGDDRPLVLLAGGIGITPLMSMLRHAVAADPQRPVTLLYSAREPHDLVFGDELKLIVRRHAQVRVVPTLTGTSSPTGWRTGRIDAALVREQVALVEHAIFYICGPQPMIREMQAMLASLGVPAAQVRTEAFQAAAGARSEAAVQPAMPAARPDLTLRLVRTGREVPADARQTLLEAAEAAGVALPSLCRAGVCGTCRTRLIEGDVHCTSSMAEPDDGWILPCVSWPRGSCAIEA